jgi:CHAD domain-containing protein
MRSPGAAFELRAALSDEIRGAMHELNSAEASAKALHRCRLHLKRARALARVGRSVAPGLSAVFNESARGVMHILAQARDLTALSSAARGLAKKSNRKERKALNTVAEALDAQRATLPALDFELVRASLRDLLALAQVWPEASVRQINRGAERIARRARRACRRGRGKEVAPHRHEWRKREKDRLYAVTLLNGSWPRDRKRRKKRCEELGEALGRERDALLLIERLGVEPIAAGSEKAARHALAALKRQCHTLGRRADRIGARLHRGGA